MSAPMYQFRPGGFEDEDSDDEEFFLGSIGEDKEFSAKSQNVVKFHPKFKQQMCKRLNIFSFPAISPGVRTGVTKCMHRTAPYRTR